MLLRAAAEAASSSVDLINAITALIGAIGTTLGAAVSFFAARALIRNNKNQNGSGGNGSSGESSGPTGGGSA